MPNESITYGKLICIQMGLLNFRDNDTKTSLLERNLSYSFNGLDYDQFLSEYWQQSPLLVRNAFVLPPLLDGDELAGLATEPDVESRLIQVKEDLTDWKVEHGPFDNEMFEALPKSHWTLLVQAVDHWVPEVRELLTAFHFLPKWRIDDVMISFATAGGGVGPHFDQYDVFLIQLSGEREWKVGQLCDESSDTVEDVPVKLLTNFEETDRWVLKPGDVLYVPPAIAHWGTAINDSITISVGFRAPASSEVVAEFGHFLSTQLSDFERYSDSEIENREKHPHEIFASDISRLKSLLTNVFEDDELITQWFGQYMTEPKYSDMTVETGNLTLSELKTEWQKQPLCRNASSRMAFSTGKLFADGQTYQTALSNTHLHKLCNNDEIEIEMFSDVSDKLAQLTLALINQGVFFFEN